MRWLASQRWRRFSGRATTYTVAADSKHSADRERVWPPGGSCLTAERDGPLPALGSLALSGAFSTVIAARRREALELHWGRQQPTGREIL
jgi:hypothetical protein